MLEPATPTRTLGARRTRRLPMLVAVLVTALVGAVGIILANGGLEEPEMDGTNFSIALAQAEMDLSQSVEISVRFDVDGSWVVADYRLDRASLRFAVDMIGDGEFAAELGVTESGLGYRLDERNEMSYTSIEFAVEAFDVPVEVIGDRTWVAEPLDDWWQAGTIEQFFADVVSIDELTEFGAVEDIGFERIDDSWVRRYDVTVDLQSVDSYTYGDYASLGFAPDDVIVLQVWITEDNQLRRMVLDGAQQGVDARYTADVKRSGNDLDIELPNPGETISSEELFEAAGQRMTEVIGD